MTCFPRFDAPENEVIDFFLSSKSVRRVRNRKRAAFLSKRGEDIRYFNQVRGWLWIKPNTNTEDK